MTTKCPARRARMAALERVRDEQGGGEPAICLASHGFGTSDLSRSCQRQRGARARFARGSKARVCAACARCRPAPPTRHRHPHGNALVLCSMSCHTYRLLWLPARQQSWRMARAESMQQERGAQTRPRVASCVVRAPGARRVGAQHGARARTSRGRRELGHSFTHTKCVHNKVQYQ